MTQVLGHLQSYKAGPHYHRAAYIALGYELLDTVRIVDIPQGKHPGAADTLQRGHHRRSTGGKQEPVVTLIVGPPAGGPHRHGLACRIDLQHLRAGPHVHIEPAPETLRGLHEQIVPVGDHPADIVRQAAVGIGDILPLFEHDDFGLLRIPSDPGSGSRPSGDTTYNKNFHNP